MYICVCIHIHLQILVFRNCLSENKHLINIFFSLPEATPTTVTALHKFGAEILRLSRGLETSAANATAVSTCARESCNAATAPIGLTEDGIRARCRENTKESLLTKRQASVELNNGR